MRAARCEEYGGPENVVIRDIPGPEVTPGHVLVDVAAAAVNYPDLLFIANKYQVPAQLPFTPGAEFAGRVAAVGEGVTGLSAGDLSTARSSTARWLSRCWRRLARSRWFRRACR